MCIYSIYERKLTEFEIKYRSKSEIEIKSIKTWSSLRKPMRNNIFILF